MNPYYDKNGITIYHGDCREVLPTLDSFDLVLTDPPYGMNYKPDKSHATNTNRSNRQWKPIEGDDRLYNPKELLTCRKVITWGANWYASRLPDSGGWLVFNKRGDGKPSENSYGDCEVAWTNVTGAVRMFSWMWHGAGRWQAEPVLHPNQKPVPLMAWCLSLVDGVKSVVDPYMGCGPTLVAAKLAGIRAVGCDVEEEYCEKAANRLRQGVLPFAG